jgi:hypothetical protein
LITAAYKATLGGLAAGKGAAHRGLIAVVDEAALACAALGDGPAHCCLITIIDEATLTTILSECSVAQDQEQAKK